jgi:hypothetical protein
MMNLLIIGVFAGLSVPLAKLLEVLGSCNRVCQYLKLITSLACSEKKPSALPAAVNFINILRAHFLYKFWCQKLRSWNVTKESCVIQFCMKKARIKYRWNWHLQMSLDRVRNCSRMEDSYFKKVKQLHKL